MNHKPKIPLVPLADALRWRGGSGFIYEEKLDGRWHELSIGNSILCGEIMPSGEFFAFDCISAFGADIRSQPLKSRQDALGCVFPTALRPRQGTGGEFLETILANGGEGVVAKRLDAPFGVDWYKAKRREVFYCLVTEKREDGRSAVRLGVLGREIPPFQELKNHTPVFNTSNFEDGGWIPLHGAKFDRVDLGTILKVEAFGQNKSGKLREARLEMIIS